MTALLLHRYNALQMTVDAGFTPDKTSAFAGILLETLDASMRDFLPLESSFALFKELLTKHCVQVNTRNPKH